MSSHRSAEFLGANSAGPDLPGSLRDGAGPLARLAHAIAEYRKWTRDRRELSGMSDRELRDIGITRGEIGRVLGPAFAREYARRGSFVPPRLG